ncbi:MAG: CPBP family intramembrane metalloprotease [Deltaproteobacteria bacterium]|nr:CPBP family intramembrane metalloprotease [Deltaproteobacteria bacterium]
MIPSTVWVTRRLWPGLAEFAMAFAGLVVGWVAVVALLTMIGQGPWNLAAASLITAVGAWFYAKIGPLWGRAARDEDDDQPVVAEVLRSTTPLVPTVLMVLLGIAAALLGSIGAALLVELVGIPVEEQATVLEITTSARANGPTVEAVVLASSALLLAPAAEELLFRRLLFVRVAARSGRPLAYTISALAFAVVHGNPAGFIVYLWLGLVFAAVLERTGRLSAAIAVHIGNNAYVLALLFWAP